MIDEKKLIEEFEKLVVLRTDVYGEEKKEIAFDYSDIKNIVNNIPKIGGWISCEKKMPEKTGRYYIVSVKNEVSNLEYTRPALYDDSGFATKITEKVIAWQPLPESYRGGNTQ